MSKATPGPWTFEKFKDGMCCIQAILPRDGGGTYLQGLAWTVGLTPPADEYNARLIAAAPEMYEALKAVMALPDNRTTEEWRAAHAKMRAAIAKAEGASE